MLSEKVGNVGFGDGLVEGRVGSNQLVCREFTLVGNRLVFDGVGCFLRRSVELVG